MALVSYWVTPESMWLETQKIRAIRENEALSTRSPKFTDGKTA
jgi:hypothetical protein